MTFYWHCHQIVIKSPHRNDSLVWPHVNPLISRTRLCSHRQKMLVDHTHWSGIHLVFFFSHIIRNRFSFRQVSIDHTQFYHSHIRWRSVSMPIWYCFFFCSCHDSFICLFDILSCLVFGAWNILLLLWHFLVK